MKIKKVIAAISAAALLAVMASGCGGAASSSNSGTSGTSSSSSAAQTSSSSESKFDSSMDIAVITREDGSGTRGAFIELFGIEQKNSEGKKVDMTTDDAMTTNSTSVMMTTVAGSEYAIGYCSLGSLNNTVKAVTINGVEATAENVASGKYEVARPFNIVVGDKLSDVAQDFVDYILSTEGQKVVKDAGYIALSDTKAYAGSSPEGSIAISGSSSVTPVMEKLAEAYKAVNANAKVELQTSDSTTGIQDAIDGACDIGMASRDLKDAETGVTSIKIATDGIAVIVNNECPVDDLKKEQVLSIYTAEITAWSDLVD